MNTHINFYANPSSGNRVVQCGPMEGPSDMTKLITATILITSVLSHIKKAISHYSEGRYKRNAPQHIQLHSYRILRNSNQQIHSNTSKTPGLKFQLLRGGLDFLREVAENAFTTVLHCTEVGSMRTNEGTYSAPRLALHTQQRVMVYNLPATCFGSFGASSKTYQQITVP